MKSPNKLSFFIFLFSIIVLIVINVGGERLAAYCIMIAAPLITIYLFLFERKNPLRMLFFHLGSRFVLGSFPYYTYSSIVVGTISYMKLYSVFFTVLALLYLVSKRQLRLNWLLLVFISVAFPAILTAIFHADIFNLLETLNRWLYIMIVILLTKFSLQKSDESAIFRSIVICAIYPILNLFTAVLKGNEIYSTGAYRYIGTYNHQSELSSILFAAIPAALFLFISEKEEIYWKYVGIVTMVSCHVGIYLTQYRTLWIGLVFYWIVFLILAFLKITTEKRIMLFIGLSLSILIIGISAGPKILERVAPLYKVLSSPLEYCELENNTIIIGSRLKRNNMLSGRIDIWRASLLEFKKSPIENKFFGLGFDSVSENLFKHFGSTAYAHNEYVSSLIENGILGLIGFLLWVFVFSTKLLAEVQYSKWEIFVSLPMFFSILVIAMGTMPFRNLKCVLVLGVYLGIALYHRGVTCGRAMNKKQSEELA